MATRATSRIRPVASGEPWSDKLTRLGELAREHDALVAARPTGSAMLRDFLAWAGWDLGSLENAETALAGDPAAHPLMPFLQRAAEQNLARWKRAPSGDRGSAYFAHPDIAAIAAQHHLSYRHLFCLMIAVAIKREVPGVFGSDSEPALTDKRLGELGVAIPALANHVVETWGRDDVTMVHDGDHVGTWRLYYADSPVPVGSPSAPSDLTTWARTHPPKRQAKAA